MTAEPVERVQRLCLALPEAYEEEAWGEATFRVRKKIFCMAGGHHPAKPSISLKVGREDQPALLAHGDPFFFPPTSAPKAGPASTSPADWSTGANLKS